MTPPERRSYLTNNNIFKTTDYEPSYIIYLNTPNAKCTSEFLSEYIIKCIDNNMDYYLKGLNINGNNKDRTIIYSNQNDYNNKLNIITEILNEHPEWSNKFGTPISFIKPSTESLYSVSNYINYEITFIDYFNDLCEVSYYRVLAKLLLNRLDNNNELTIINSIINLNNIVPKELPSKTIYNAYTFDEKLVCLPTVFRIKFIAARSSQVNDASSWSLEEMIGFFDKYGTQYTYSSISKEGMLDLCLTFYQSAVVEQIKDDSFWGAEIVQFVADTTTMGDITLRLVPRSGDFIIEFGTLGNGEEKLSKLQRFYDNGLSSIGWSEYKTIDVRYDKQVICTK